MGWSLANMLEGAGGSLKDAATKKVAETVGSIPIAGRKLATAVGGKPSKADEMASNGTKTGPDIRDDILYMDMYRYGVQNSQSISIGNGDRVALTQWDPISRRIDNIEDNALGGRMATIRYFDLGKKGLSDKVLGTSKFFMESASQSYADRYQIVQTFGENYAIFFGQQPRIFNYSGQLLNTESYNWRLDFIDLYEKHWSGTKAVEQNSQILLTFAYEQVYGYMLGVNTSINSVNDRSAPFSFQLLVTKIVPLNRSLDKEPEPKPEGTVPTANNTGAIVDTAKKITSKKAPPKKISPPEEVRKIAAPLKEADPNYERGLIANDSLQMWGRELTAPTESTTEKAARERAAAIVAGNNIIRQG